MNVIYPELSANQTLKDELPFITQPHNYQHVVNAGIPFLTSLDQLPELQRDNRPIAIIGGGSTLMKDEKALRELNARDDVIKVFTGSTHRKVGNGELKGTTYCVIGFARADKDGMVNYLEPKPDITYIVAAQSAPEIFAKIKASGARVFAVNGYVEGAAQNPEGLIGIGNTSATAALGVFAGLLERKNFEVYGVDSSTKYSYDVPSFKPEEKLVQVPDGRTFIVETGFYDAQTPDLVKFAQGHPEIKIHVHGDSVNAALINKPQGAQPAPDADPNGLEPG